MPRLPRIRHPRRPSLPLRPISPWRAPRRGQPPRPWRILADPEKVASCLPGAELESVDGAAIRGKLRIRLGPMATAFTVEGVQHRDDAQRTGHVQGVGRDTMTGSRARGRIDFAVESAGDGHGTRLELKMSFAILGVLAQFSRGAVVQDLARQLVGQFAANLAALLDGRAPAQAPGQINAAAMLLAALRRWARRLFRR
jgi:carbon monoxide dehydrogenase subunit G